jgi:transcriptional regulator with XRE-family HTH domain
MGEHVVVDPRYGALLNELRTQRAWSLRGLGERVHCSHGHIWDLEHGQKRPSPAHLAEIAQGLAPHAGIDTVDTYIARAHDLVAS